jgi:hypothetical protein
VPVQYHYIIFSELTNSLAKSNINNTQQQGQSLLKIFVEFMIQDLTPVLLEQVLAWMKDNGLKVLYQYLTPFLTDRLESDGNSHCHEK